MPPRRLADGTARALFLLVVSAAALAAAGTEEPATVTVPLPEGTVVYIRYGEPGGVLVNSTRTTREWSGVPGSALEDSAAAAAPLWSGALSLDALRAMIRDELAALRGAAGLPVSAPGAAAAAGQSGVGPRTATGPAATAIRPGPARGAVVERRSPTGGAAALPGAGSVVAPAATEALVASLQETSPEAIRSQLLDTGVFRTSLILFATDRAELVSRSQEIIGIVGEVLRDHPGLVLRVEGHADHRGPEAYNLELSRKRAASVADYLAQECGLDPARIEAVGYGESRPLVEGRTPTDLALNRRVEFRIVDPADRP